MNNLCLFFCSTCLLLCSAGRIWASGPVQTETQTSETDGLLPFLGQQIDALERFNEQQAIRAVPLQYLGSDPTLYDQAVRVPPGCPSSAFVLLAVYDTEIALRRSERDRFLHLADFLYGRLVKDSEDLNVFATTEAERELINMIQSHAACLMQKAGHKPLPQPTGEKQTHWNIRLRTAEAVNDLSFHQRVQEILTLQDDLDHLRDFFANHLTALRTNQGQWMAAHKNDEAILKAAQIIRHIPQFGTLKEDEIGAFQAALEEEYRERLGCLWTDPLLAEQIAQQECQEIPIVSPIVQSMFRVEIEKFIGYLENLTHILRQPRNIYAVECGATDRRTTNTCGLNSLLIKDAICGHIQSLRADSCALVEALSQTSKAVQRELSAALSKDPGRPRSLTLKALAAQSIQFESAGTSGSYAGQTVQRPTQDWLLPYKGRTVVQPAAVQSDLLELVAYAHDYNMVVLTKGTGIQSLPRLSSLSRIEAPTKAQPLDIFQKPLINPLPALPIAKVSSTISEMRRQSQVHRPNAQLAVSRKIHPTTLSPQENTAQAFLPMTWPIVRRESSVSEVQSLATFNGALGANPPRRTFTSLSNVPVLSCVQSISIFSPYQEIRFLIHVPGHYQAVEFYSPIPRTLHYGQPTEWYQRKVKGIIQQSQQ